MCSQDIQWKPNYDGQNDEWMDIMMDNPSTNSQDNKQKHKSDMSQGHNSVIRLHHWIIGGNHNLDFGDINGYAKWSNSINLSL